MLRHVCQIFNDAHHGNRCFAGYPFSLCFLVRVFFLKLLPVRRKIHFSPKLQPSFVVCLEHLRACRQAHDGSAHLSFLPDGPLPFGIFTLWSVITIFAVSSGRSRSRRRVTGYFTFAFAFAFLIRVVSEASWVSLGTLSSVQPQNTISDHHLHFLHRLFHFAGAQLAVRPITASKFRVRIFASRNS